MKDIRELFRKHEQESFPVGHRNKQVAGAHLSLLNSEIMTIVVTFLSTNGSISSRHRVVIDKHLSTLKTVLLEIESDAQPFFLQLLDLGSQVLASAHNQPSWQTPAAL